MHPADSFVTHDSAARLSLYVWPGPGLLTHNYQWEYGDGESPCGGSFAGDHCAAVEHAIARLRQLRAESARINAMWDATRPQGDGHA